MPNHLRRSSRRSSIVALVVLMLAGLTSAVSAAPGPPHDRGAPGRDAPPAHAQQHRELTVVTRNLYLGAELTPLFAAGSQEELVAAATATFQEALASDFPARARELARELVDADADLVGLQEVSLWRTGPFGGSAEDVQLDFLALLLAELAELGASYEPVSVISAFDGQLPIATDQGLATARLTDRDVILARSDQPASGLKVEGSDAGTFDTILELPLLDQTLPIDRGWASVDVKVRGKRVRLVDTHLEAFGPEEIRRAQVAELLAGPLDTDLPVVLVGDINSDASSGQAYADLRQAGFDDAWLTVDRDEDGETCCYDRLLDPDPDPVTDLTSRIDVVLTRGAVTAVDAERIGDDPDARTPSGRWPSDHAGVVATVRIPPR